MHVAQAAGTIAGYSIVAIGAICIVAVVVLFVMWLLNEF